MVRERGSPSLLGGTASAATSAAVASRAFMVRRLRPVEQDAVDRPVGRFVTLGALQAVAREADLLTEADRHPHLLRCHAAVIDNAGKGHCRVLLCEPCIGDLAGHLSARRDGPGGSSVGSSSVVLPPDEVTEIGTQIAAGVAHLHRAANTVAGPLDTSSVLRGEDGLWKVADLGRALRLPATLGDWRRQQPGGGCSLFNRQLGCPPECADVSGNSEDTPITTGVDSWLLGSMLCLLAFGYSASGSAPSGAPSALESRVEARLWVLLHWPLVEDPAERPLARELAAMLGAAVATPPEELLSSLPQTAKRQCTNAVLAVVTQLAVQEAASAAPEAGSHAGHSCAVGRLAATPIAELRRGLADPSLLDMLCANCGLDFSAVAATARQ